jgi:hypothetical protein
MGLNEARLVALLRDVLEKRHEDGVLIEDGTPTYLARGTRQASIETPRAGNRPTDTYQSIVEDCAWAIPPDCGFVDYLYDSLGVEAG